MEEEGLIDRRNRNEHESWIIGIPNQTLMQTNRLAIFSQYNSIQTEASRGEERRAKVSPLCSRRSDLSQTCG